MARSSWRVRALYGQRILVVRRISCCGFLGSTLRLLRRQGFFFELRVECSALLLLLLQRCALGLLHRGCMCIHLRRLCPASLSASGCGLGLVVVQWLAGGDRVRRRQRG